MRTPVRSLVALAIVPAIIVAAAPPHRSAMPARVGHCARTSVELAETRLVDGDNRPVPGSGSAIRYANGGYQVSYDQVAAVDASRPGDPIRICLVSIPRHCPPGDRRGRFYKATNLRTGRSWTLSDAEHMCGGA
jgi:hypothetical protein